MPDPEIVAIQGPVIQAADHGPDRWEVRHWCSGLQRRIHVSGNSMACLDCGSTTSMFDAPDLTSGTTAVLTDGDLTAQP